MAPLKIASNDDNVDKKSSATINIRPEERRLFICPSAIDSSMPEMYNFSGEQFYFVEVPREAFNVWGEVKILSTIGIEEGSKSLRKVWTLAKMEKNIAADGQIFRKVNPADGVKTSSVTEFTATTRDGKIMRFKPQADQFEFFANSGMTKVLRVLSYAGAIMDIVNIMQFGMSDDATKEFIPIPGPLGLLNIPLKDYFDDLEKGMEEYAIQKLQATKKEGVNAVDRLVNSNVYQKLGYHGLMISGEIVKGIMNERFKTIDEVRDASFRSSTNTTYMLYRERDTAKGKIAVIEAFFFEKIE